MPGASLWVGGRRGASSDSGDDLRGDGEGYRGWAVGGDRLRGMDGGQESRGQGANVEPWGKDLPQQAMGESNLCSWQEWEPSSQGI